MIIKKIRYRLFLISYSEYQNFIIIAFDIFSEISGVPLKKLKKVYTIQAFPTEDQRKMNLCTQLPTVSICKTW